jgi:amino acid adenylation domain-containing protein/non-ribosomal peptide synthase protein (TIGR01720 family)
MPLIDPATMNDRLSALSPEQRALFEKLREKQRNAARTARTAVRPPQPPPVRRVTTGAGEGDWPLSLDQERFWFMEQLYPGHAGLNITAATRMRGPMSVPAMGAGLDEIVRRHAAWRTIFPVVAGRPVQRVGPARHQRMTLLDLSGLPAARREPEMLRLLGAATAAPFELDRGTLVRSGLVRLGERDHVCLLTVHHLVTDWISFQIAFGELAVFYDAFVTGRVFSEQRELPAPPVQYPDFAVWQREWLQGEVLDGLTSWWREQLAGFPLTLELPTDRPRPAVARMRGGSRAVRASRELSEALRGLARREGATLFMTVLALTAALFHRLSGQERLILGANNANRNRPELEPVLGCFLTQVPFPVDLTGDPAFRELLARTRRSALGALAHQDLPFGKLVEALEPVRDPSRQPVIQALVQVLDGQYSKAELAGVAFEPVDAHDGNARYDLFLTLFDYPDGLAGGLEYDSDLFDATTAERLAELLFLQAERAAADPDLRLGELPVLSEAQAQQALVEWNDTARPLTSQTLTELFTAQAKRAPDAVAVISRGGTLTYGELDRRSDELAYRLVATGVEPGARVALILGRTPDIPVAIFGCWKAGAAFVPLDPEWPAERRALVLEDAEPAAVVRRGGNLAVEAGVRALDLDASEPAPPCALPAPDPHRLAYLIYTSGTTGRPKAVMVEHRGVAAMIGCLLDFGIGPGDRVPHLSRYTFDITFLEVVLPLVAGAVCEIVDTEEVLDPEGFLSILERSTRVFTMPALLRRAVPEALAAPGWFAGLRTLSSGGDLASPDLLARMLEAFPATDLLVLYGPTETSILCTGHRLSRVRNPERALIGRPLANVEARVVDPGGRPVPLGVPGELWIGGPGLARGYFRREELTAERFVPLGGQPDGRRFYRTGDLVRQVPGEGGELEFLGRIDAQVKIRGIRIEPGEIEAALRDHPAVRDAAVVAMPAGGDKQLVAYVVGTDAADTADGLRAFLRSRLPEGLIPSVFVPLEAMPITSHGKVDRKALPAPQAAREALAAATGAEAPRNAREELLAGIWRELLGLERVGVHDNFFRLGGDSILSIQVVARARQAGLLVTTRQFFDNQTIAGLAAVAETTGEPSPIDEGPVEGEAPLTPVQRRFFGEERREPRRFNLSVMLAPRERLDAARLAAALQRLAMHHDALRLRFTRETSPPSPLSHLPPTHPRERGNVTGAVEQDRRDTLSDASPLSPRERGPGGEVSEGWRQIYAPDPVVPLLEIDLGDSEGLDDAAERLQSGLDLARGPLFTAALFRRAEGDRLLLTAHHLIVDGVSWRILIEDLEAAYRGRELPPKTTSWKCWAGLLTAFAAEVTDELPYWLSLPSLPSLRSLPPAGPEAAPFELSPEATRALLQEAPEAYHTQVNDLLLAALVRAARAWTGDDTLLVDLEGHGREEIFPGVDLSRTVGWFTTLFPVALALPPSPDTAGPRESILAVKETLRAVPRRGLGYGLLRYVHPEAAERLAALPAPRISFNYLGQLGAAGETGLFDFAPEAPRGAQAETADRPRLALDCVVVDGRLRVICASERLARGFLAEVEALVGHCLSPEAGGFSPSDFPLAGVDQAALDRLLGADRNVEDLYPLAPLQEGILFHSTRAPASDPYFQQLTAGLAGPLDAAAFKGAWQRVLDRHPAPRTVFLWRKVERPLQLVRRTVEMPWTVEDWRGVPDLEARWQGLLAADRARGFDLERAPLMRVALVRTGEASHRLAWSSHHLTFDGWCLSILLSEVFALYRGEPLLPPPRPYRDYIAWLARRDQAEAESFWRDRLQGFTEPTPLPFDHRSNIAGGAGGGEPFEASVSLPAAAPGALAQRLQVTVNTLVQGAWALLLSRYAQVPEVVFGAVVSGRPAELPGVESMIGLFINTLPVRIAIPAAEPAAAWLARVQEAQLELVQYQWTPLARIQSLARAGSGALFASLLAFENYPMSPASEEPGELRILDAVLAERTNYPLNLIAVAREDLTLRLVASRRFEPAAARRMLGHLERLLEGLAADPTRPPSALPMLTAAETRQLLVEWSGAAEPFPETTIHGRFLEQAALTPDAVAVEMGDETLTYAGLRERAERIARRLAARGLRPEQRVAVRAERSPEMIAALLGILQAGGAYVPIDPAWPAERQEWMLRDAGAVWLDDEGLGDGEIPDVPAGSLAHVLYTSGSTGMPKGVAVTHRNVVRLATAVAAELGPDQAWLQYGPLSFDASTLEIWTPLLSGGRVVLFPGRMGSLDELARVIERRAVTAVWLTAGLFHEMVDGRLDGLRPLRHLLTGGDVVSPDHARRALAAHPGLTLIDGYGPTENTVFTSWHRLTGPDQVEDPVPIGRPIANTRVLVLDEDLRPVPIGVWGELCAGGDGLARGYLSRPELTAERFVPNPESGERLYRTGDRVRWRADGTLEFLGRLDFQVKIRGFRIEPGEVEAALLACPGVQRGVVAVSGQGAGKSLRAFWVGEATADELRSSLRSRLPEALVPPVFIPLPDLPLTPNGKVDRRALAALEASASRPRERAAPRTPLEETLVDAAAEVLERRPEEVGVRDNFFELGGHSLLATRFVSLLSLRHGIEVPLQLVFETADLAELAGRILESGLAGDGGEVRIPRRSPEREPVPASFAQERLWFLDRLAPGKSVFNIPLMLRIAGDLSPSHLEWVLGELIRRHETLRTTFGERGGEPVQIVAPPGPWTLPMVDLAWVPQSAREMRRLAQAEVERPFDLEAGPLLRAVLLRFGHFGDTEHALLLDLHHIVADGWSLGVLVHDISALYGGAPLAPLPIQYADFAVWQRGWLRGEVLEEQIAWWRESLAGAPASLDLPTDRPRPATQTYLGTRFQVPFDAVFSRDLARFARRQDATPFMVFLAAFQALLGRLSGQDDLTVGSPIANRHRSEVEPLIGFFVNTLVLRGDLRGDPPFRELLARARRAALGAFAHQDLPFERLVMELRPERHLSVTPLFQAVCAMQNAPVGSMDVPGLTLDRIPFEVTTSQFDLELHLWEADGAYTGDLSYSSELFDGATVRRLVSHLETLLRSVIADPGLRLSELPLLPESERHQLLQEWNDKSPPLPGRGTREDRERGSGGEGPDILSLVIANAPKALLDRASRLAGELRSLGVGPDVPAGLCVERSPELVTGALAVLLAGGAYLPLDPAWPEDRLAFVVEESRMPVLLVRGEAPSWVNGVKVIDLDRPPSAEPVQPPPPDPDRLAYVIYTSGSTGRPKGVQVPHRGLLNLVLWHQRTYGVTREDRATLVASPAFDASVWEIWPYLAAGASLHVPDSGLRLDPERLLAWMVEEGITLSFLPTPLAEQVLDVRPPEGLRLRALLTGGDRLQQAPRQPLPFALVNHYGPTESSVVATCAGVEPGSSRAPVIGRPIAGTRAYVVDALLQPAPIGIPGELVLAGSGLARGYLGRPDLTAERFIPDPFSEGGERLYRTGDLARLLPDGNLDFLGRVDTQVKLRGFRIELGEIESALLRHPEVREAVVTLRDGAAGLAAYVVCRPESITGTGEAAEHVTEWQTLYDETYARGDHRDRQDATFDIVGWNSSYTGQPIPAVEMREWVENTVERIRALHPKRVVEIGCGTGLLLFRVAPETESYLGIDFSRVALEGIRRRLDGLPQVTLRQGEADDWTGIPSGEADLVILNSVCQYFPGIDYLVRVLEGAVKAVKPGGAVFVGDVRSLPLLAAFAESVERFQAPPNRSEEEIRRRIRRRVADEEELAVDPAFFQALAERVPGITGVDLLAKQGRWDNELTRYRYDVVLRTGSASLPRLQPSDIPSDLPWSVFANDPLRTRLARRMIPELRRHLQTELPDYMIPSSFVLLDSLPVTANGKVDRAALPEPEPIRMTEEGTPPGTPSEKAMADLWKEVLGVGEVRLEDNFFDLGGHSLLATQLVSRIRTAFGIDLPLRRLFEKPTLGDLAAAVETETAPAAVIAPPRVRRTEAPLSLAQERFWYFGRTGNTAYNVANSLRLRGPVDTEALERCFREMIRRHDTLRTRFVERDGTAIQVIDPPGPWLLPRIDLEALPDREREALRLVREDALRPFDIVQGPLLRAALIRLGAEDHAVILNCHHIAVDGWSMGVLVSELMELYRAFAAGEPSPLPELEVQYPDLAVWQRERLTGPVMAARLDWWRETLKGAPGIWSFPLDRPRSAASTHRGVWVPRTLPASFADRLKALGSAEGASLYMVVLAGLSLVLRSWTGQDDLVVGSPLAGRERGESERMIGVFLNLLPMRIDLSGDPTFRELLRRARHTALEAYTHQEISFEALVAALGLKREPTYNPIFQCTLNMLNFPAMGGGLPGGVDVEPIRVGEVGCKYDFTLYGTDTPEGLTFNLLYAVDLFDRSRMEALQDRLREVLELAVEHPDLPIGRFPATAPDVVA